MEQYVKGFQRFHVGEDVRPVSSCKFLLIYFILVILASSGINVHSLPIIPRGSFRIECEKIGGLLGVGDHFGSRTGVILSSMRGQTQKNWRQFVFLRQQQLEKVIFAGKNEENTTKFITFLN